MSQKLCFLAIIALFAIVNCYELEDSQNEELKRFKRFQPLVNPNLPTNKPFPFPNKPPPAQPDGWVVMPKVSRQDHSTQAGIDIIHHGKNHNFYANWDKVIDGPLRDKPTWFVGYERRFRRSPQPDNEQPKGWEVNPGVSRDGNGNTNAGVGITHHGDDHDFSAGWDQTVRGPNKRQGTWHVGGKWRFRRSPQPDNEQPKGWEVNPGVSRDGNGNTNAGVGITHHGDDHDFSAGWDQTVRGPNKKQGTWHVGGKWRFRRSPQPDNEQPKGWEVNPGVSRDGNGNTNAGVGITHHGDDHDFSAGWDQTVRGPNKRQGTWHVGGKWRFKRSPNGWEVNPGVSRDGNGNTNAGVGVQHHGDNHDFSAGWDQTVRGPNKKQGRWHVGGKWRFH